MDQQACDGRGRFHAGAPAGHRFVACEWEISSTKHPRLRFPPVRKPPQRAPSPTTCAAAAPATWTSCGPTYCRGNQHLEGVVDPLQSSWWISYRYIPTGRAGLSDILRGAGCTDPASPLFKTLAFTTSDQYWIRPAGLAVSWAEINYFGNPYVDGHAVWTAADGVHVRIGPGSATSGQLAKRWESRAGQNMLVKGLSGTDCHEPWAEELTQGPCLTIRVLRQRKHKPARPCRRLLLNRLRRTAGVCADGGRNPRPVAAPCLVRAGSHVPRGPARPRRRARALRGGQRLPGLPPARLGQRPRAHVHPAQPHLEGRALNRRVKHRSTGPHPPDVVIRHVRARSQ